MAKKKKIPVKIKLYKDGELIKTFWRAIYVHISVVSRIEKELVKYDYDFGVVKVTYNKKKDYWNEFEFRSEAQFREHINPCLDRQLIKDFS